MLATDISSAQIETAKTLNHPENIEFQLNTIVYNAKIFHLNLTIAAGLVRLRKVLLIKARLKLLLLV